MRAFSPTLDLCAQHFKVTGGETRVAHLTLACAGIARLVHGIPRFPCGNAGGMGF